MPELPPEQRPDLEQAQKDAHWAHAAANTVHFENDQAVVTIRGTALGRLADHIHMLLALLSTREEELRRLRKALTAASEFEREYQRQRGAVLSSDDYLMLDELQTRFLESFAEVGQVEHGPPVEDLGGDR